MEKDTFVIVEQFLFENKSVKDMIELVVTTWLTNQLNTPHK